MMTMKKTNTLLIAATILCAGLKAQQDPMFTHYMYNTLWLNPAYAGTRNALSFTAIHRSQWAGYSGAPTDQSLTMHMPIQTTNVGLGLSFLNDRIGPTKSTLAAIDVSYRVKLDAYSHLSFGIKGLANFYRNDLSSLSLDQQNDAAFAQNTSLIMPNVGAGVYYYHDRFYAGFSSPRLLINNLNSNGGSSIEQRHFYTILGAMFRLPNSVNFKPTVFIKATKGAPLQADVTATFILKEKYNLGLMYRTGDAVGILAGYDITTQFYVGYAFDWSVANVTGHFNPGSHEIVLRYDLKLKNAPHSDNQILYKF
jgi:type IX secretion system PorP/SprF family membrane protein